MRALQLASGAFMLILVSGCGWIRGLTEMPPSERPKAYATPRVLAGANSFRKQLVHETAEDELGVVSDIRPNWPSGSALALVGTRGARFIGADGKLQKAIQFSEAPRSAMSLIMLDAQGSYGFLNREQSWASDVLLFDSEGKLKWRFEAPTGVNDSSAGDVDGDGRPEILVGLNGDGGIFLLDANGKKLWRQDGGNIWHVEMIDADGDGRSEILHSGGHYQYSLTLRDKQGAIIKHLKRWAHIGDFTVARWQKDQRENKIVFARNGSIQVCDTDGDEIEELESANITSVGAVRSTPVYFLQGEAHFATVTSYFPWERSLLVIHDSRGKLVYEEVVDGECIAVAPHAAGRSEVLLLGCRDKVFEYSLR